MYLLAEPKTKVRDLYEFFEAPADKHDALTSNIKVDLTTEDHTIEVRTGGGQTNKWEIEGNGLIALGDWLGVPSKFMAKMQPHEQQFILNGFAGRNFEPVVITTNKDGLVKDIYNPEQLRIEPLAVVDIAAEILGVEADVIDYRSSPTKGFTFDIVSNDERARGGDLRVNDITRGGLRFGQEVGLAPWVQKYLYRLFCTNGMEMADHNHKISVRNQDLDTILAELLEISAECFHQLDVDINEFYALRDIRTTTPERTLRRIAREQGLTDHIINELIDSIGLYLAEDGSISHFDIVNLITNLANNPKYHDRPAFQRRLQSAGGRIVHDNSVRCGTCSSKLS